MGNLIKTAASRGALAGGALVGLVFTGLMLASGANAAEGDDPGLDAITGLGSKVTIYGAAIIAVVVISVGIMLGIKYLRIAGKRA